MSGKTRREFLKLSAAAGTVAIMGGYAMKNANQNTGEIINQKSPVSKICVTESPRQTPVIHETDLCVIGGSCTGVFAAVRAARLGARVTIIERANCFGGVATISLVNVWHSPLDTTYTRPIIAGLTSETMSRLTRRNAVVTREKSPAWAWAFNPYELQIELDELIRENKITPMLHTMFVAPHVENGELKAVLVENKSGRGAVRAQFFIDASGDADVCHRLGLATYTSGELQPSTTCATILQKHRADIGRLIRDHGAEVNLPNGFVWGAPIPGSDVQMLAGTRMYHENCSEAESLTRAEIEGRRQVRAILDLVRKYSPESEITLQGLPSRIGIRETRHVRCHYQLTGHDVLEGVRFNDAIANGSYRVDVHHHDKPGITLQYLDGHEEYCVPGQPAVVSRWRPEREENPTFYQIPYRSILPQSPFGNLLIAGRMLDADLLANAAVRVMVNMNQTGEAAGTAAYMCLNSGCGARQIDTAKLRDLLARNGSAII